MDEIDSGVLQEQARQLLKEQKASKTLQRVLRRRLGRKGALQTRQIATAQQSAKELLKQIESQAKSDLT